MIPKNEVLRYLAYNDSEINDTVDSLIDECIVLTEKSIQPKHIYKVFEINSETYSFLLGNDIKEHLAGCEKYILSACTIGIGVDSLIRRYENTNITKALIIDACSSVAVENFQNKAIMSLPFEHLTFAYSPGYGDLPLDIQSKILKLLSAQKYIGLSANEEHIMIPRKSITSIIGIGEKPVAGKAAGCKNCLIQSKCIYRKKGRVCYD